MMGGRHGRAAIHRDVADRPLDRSRDVVSTKVSVQPGVAAEERHPAARLVMGPDCRPAVRRLTLESIHVACVESVVRASNSEGPEGVLALRYFVVHVVPGACGQRQDEGGTAESAGDVHVSCGWSDSCRAGFAPAGGRCLSTAHRKRFESGSGSNRGESADSTTIAGSLAPSRTPRLSRGSCVARRGRCEESGYQVRPDAGGDPGCRLPDGVSCEMGVASGRLYFGVPEQLADHRQGLAKRQRPRGERVPQVVQADISESCRLAHPVPVIREMRQPRAGPGGPR